MEAEIKRERKCLQGNRGVAKMKERKKIGSGKKAKTGKREIGKSRKIHKGR